MELKDGSGIAQLALAVLFLSLLLRLLAVYLYHFPVSIIDCTSEAHIQKQLLTDRVP